MDNVYRVRYRAYSPESDKQRLFIEDTEGAFYLFSDGRLQCRLDPQIWWPRISAFMEQARYTYNPVENDRLFSLDGLSHLEHTAS